MSKLSVFYQLKQSSSLPSGGYEPVGKVSKVMADVSADMTDLKNAVKEACRPTLDNIPAHFIELWQGSTELKEALTVATLNFKVGEDGGVLNPIEVRFSQASSTSSGGQVMTAIEDIDQQLGAVFYLHVDRFRGNAIAVSASMAITSLHRNVELGTIVEVVSNSGKSRQAKVIFCQFESNVVDMAVIELLGGVDAFQVYIPVHCQPVRLKQKLSIVGLAPSLQDIASPYCADSSVMLIEPNSALFRSQYWSCEGMSGAGVITVTGTDNRSYVAGVHVATHDDTVSPPPIKKSKGNLATADSVSRSSDSLASSIHGHSSYCLICEPCRVDGVLDIIH